MKITIIAAADRNGGIGRKGELPWHCPEDLAFFKRRTLGKPVIMGSATIRSLPGGALPGRSIIALGKSTGGAASFEEALELAIAEAGRLRAQEILIGGGASVYEAALPYAHSALITRIPGDFECDRFLPEFKMPTWFPHGSEKIGEFMNSNLVVEIMNSLNARQELKRFPGLNL